MDDRTPSEEIEDVDWAIDDEVVGLVDVLEHDVLTNRVE